MTVPLSKVIMRKLSKNQVIFAQFWNKLVFALERSALDYLLPTLIIRKTSNLSNLAKCEKIIYQDNQFVKTFSEYH